MKHTLFDVQCNADTPRVEFIAQMKGQLGKRVDARSLFTIHGRLQ